MLSSIGKQSLSVGQTLRVVDKNWLQRVRVKPDEKLKTADVVSKPQPHSRSLDNLLDLSTDFDFNANSNSADFLDLGNSQMSSLFREFSNDQKSLMKDEKKTANANYKTIRGTGFYSCELCPFLCLDVKLFLEHKEQDDHNGTYPGLVGTFPFKSKCIGCDNVFYSVTVLRCHLIEDHKVSSIEIDRLIQLSIEASDDDTVFGIEPLPQIINNNVADFNSVNDTMLNCLESGQESHFMDTQDPITGENNFTDNCTANETSNEYWDNQEQIFNGLQNSNIDNDNINEKPREKLYGCLIGACKVRFETEENAMYHEKCHSAYGFCCIEFECKYSDTRWLSMMTHLWKTHGVDIEMFSCNQCGFKTNSQYKLNTFHKKIHKKEKPFICPECNKGFKSIKQLRNHKVIHKKKTKTEKPLRTDLSCMHCSRNFSTKSLLHQHITSIHIRVRPFACQECNYTTSVASSLKLHIRSHTGEKPFKCEECSFSTADHNTLRKHKMRHTGQKKYTCPLCNYSCIQSASYKKHLETKHPGIDDGIIYNCDMCNFTFIRKDLYMLHIVKHKEDALQNNGICEPPASLDEIFNEKEKIQAEIGEQPYLINTIRVKPLNTLIPNEIVSNNKYS